MIQLLYFNIRILYRQKISNYIAYVFCFISSTAVLIAIKSYYIAGDILTVEMYKSNKTLRCTQPRQYPLVVDRTDTEHYTKNYMTSHYDKHYNLIYKLHVIN